MKVGIVIAAYNEEKSIEKVLRGLPSKLKGVSAIMPIVVSDGSTDGTLCITRSVPGVTALDHVINRGQGAALYTGFRYAMKKKCDIIVSFDADGQHSATEISDVIAPIVEDRADIVLGSRFLGKKPTNLSRSRRFTLKAGVLFTAVLSRIKVTDTHNGFRAFRSEALRLVRMNQDRMEHASEILDEISRLNLRYVEVPVTIAYTDYSKAKGQSSLGALKIAFKMLVHKLLT